MSILKSDWKKKSELFQNRSKVHENVFIYVENDLKYLIKKLSRAEEQFLDVTKSCDYILNPKEVFEGYALFEFIETTSEISVSVHEQAILAMAQIHHYCSVNNFSFLKERNLKEWFEVFHEKGKRSGVAIDAKAVHIFYKAIDFVGKKNEVVHQDFIPENVIINRDNTYVIDWESCHLGFSEQDIGRYIGVNIPGNRFVQDEDCGDLINLYLDQRSLLNSSYSKEEGKILIKIGELVNSWDNVAMCIGCGEPDKSFKYVRDFELQATEVLRCL